MIEIIKSGKLRIRDEGREEEKFSKEQNKIKRRFEQSNVNIPSLVIENKVKWCSVNCSENWEIGEILETFPSKTDLNFINMAIQNGK